MIRVIRSAIVDPAKDVPEGEQCLYIRRDVHHNGRYQEFSYIGPIEEVQALSARCVDVDLLKVDELLRAGKTFDEALKELGK